MASFIRECVVSVWHFGTRFLSAGYHLVQRTVAWPLERVSSVAGHVTHSVASQVMRPPAYVLSVCHVAIVKVFENPKWRDLLFISVHVSTFTIYCARLLWIRFGLSRIAPLPAFLARPPQPPVTSETPTENDLAVKEFVAASGGKYTYDEKLPELGSRMRKSWYVVEKTTADGQEKEKRLVTVAPVSQSCPLQLREYQRGLNKLMEDIREQCHPYIHPIDEVAYMEHHQVLIIVQPLMDHGSLKDLIYKVATPTWKCEWSSKYAHCSKGLPPEDVARYGRQVLEGILFLYNLRVHVDREGFPVLGHVQSGNIFIVDDVCHLGGYENTLLGYKTRLFRLCKDYPAQLDVILFGHLVFEMCAGYELTQIRPSEKEYKTLPSDVRPILEYIFEDSFPHSIQDIADHDFFFNVDVKSFDVHSVKLSRESEGTLDKVRKNKPRTQRPAGEAGRVRSFFGRTLRSIRELRLPQILPQRSGGVRKEQSKKELIEKEE